MVAMADLDSKLAGQMHSIRHPQGLKQAKLPTKQLITAEVCPMQCLVYANGHSIKEAHQNVPR